MWPRETRDSIGPGETVYTGTMRPDTGPGGEDVARVFETILGDLEKVRSLNYRHALFQKWRQLVQMALNRFLGPDHPVNREFAAMEFHGPLPKPPNEPPVSERDVQAYATAMSRVEAMVRELLSSYRVAAPSRAPAEDAPVAAVPPPAPASASSATPVPEPPAGSAGMKLVFNTRDMVESLARNAPTPLTQGPSDFSQIHSVTDLPRHAAQEPPAAGIQIIARGGSGRRDVKLDHVMDTLSDVKEKALVQAIKDAMLDPRCTWDRMRAALDDLMDYRKDTLVRILPIVLKP